MELARNGRIQHCGVPVTLSKDMVGRASVKPGWPVDPGRSAGPAPHRPPRGAITRTRAPSTRAGDRLTPSYSPRRLAAADLQTTGHAAAAPPATRCGTPTPLSPAHALTHCTAPGRLPARVRKHRTKARRFAAAANKASGAHPRVLSFRFGAHAQRERLLTSPAPGLFRPAR
ncbi:unnamed protein product, partial [Iphiclides podalirius]